MTPANRQHHLLNFEKRMGEGLHFFPYRDFLLVYSRTKCHSRRIVAGYCRNRIMKILQLLQENLFLFYGKRFFFYNRLLSASGKRVFGHERHVGFTGNRSRRPECVLPILLKGFKRLKNRFSIPGEDPGASGRSFSIPNRDPATPGNLFESPNREYHVRKSLLENPDRNPGTPGRLFSISNRNPATSQSWQAAGRMDIMKFERLPVIFFSFSPLTFLLLV